VTTPYMTKYERARVLGTRALQIRCVSVDNSFVFFREFFFGAGNLPSSHSAL